MATNPGKSSKQPIRRPHSAADAPRQVQQTGRGGLQITTVRRAQESPAALHPSGGEDSPPPYKEGETRVRRPEGVITYHPESATLEEPLPRRGATTDWAAQMKRMDTEREHQQHILMLAQQKLQAQVAEKAQYDAKYKTMSERMAAASEKQETQNSTIESLTAQLNKLQTEVTKKDNVIKVMEDDHSSSHNKVLRKVKETLVEQRKELADITLQGPNAAAAQALGSHP